MSLAEITATADLIRRLAQRASNPGEVVEAALREFCNEHAGQGLAPDGTPWEPTKEGNAPLVNAASKLHYTHTDRVARVTIRDRNDARHHLGVARGAPRRQIIPDNLTPDVADKLQQKIRAHLEEADNGR